MDTQPTLALAPKLERTTSLVQTEAGRLWLQAIGLSAEDMLQRADPDGNWLNPEASLATAGPPGNAAYPAPVHFHADGSNPELHRLKALSKPVGADVVSELPTPGLPADSHKVASWLVTALGPDDTSVPSRRESVSEAAAGAEQLIASRSDLFRPGNPTVDESPWWESAAAGETPWIEQLRQEVRLSNCDSGIRAVMLDLTDELDDRGYLAAPLVDFAVAHNLPLELAQMAFEELRAVSDGQVALHEGDGLVAHAAAFGEDEELLRQLVNGNWPTLKEWLAARLPRNGAGEDLWTQRGAALEREITQAVAGLLGIDEPNAARLLRKAVKLMRHRPSAGAVEAPPAADDIEFQLVGGVVAFRTCADGLADLELCSSVRLNLGEVTDEQERRALRKAQAAGRTELRMLGQTARTLRALAAYVGARQADFIRSGALSDLRPATQKAAAHAADVDEATISRLVKHRWARTPHGRVRLSTFFPPAATSDGRHTAWAVHKVLKAIIAEENPTAPFPDAALAVELSRRGFVIARRTVAKHRADAGLPAASSRCRF